MSKRNTIFVGAALVALAGCSQNTEAAADGAAAAAVQQDALAGGKRATAKAIAQLPKEVPVLHRAQQPADLPKFEKSTRNAEGETLKVQIPVEDAPAVEVLEGAVCGVANAEGALLSCAAGMQCMSAAVGAPAKCARMPQAPRTDG